ncbi:hypothetical protein GCM10010191_85150 [Actinomadura vinacea]|uniref:DUF3040 domain-containing protein n=1 Tax=Actinomadura vinacea TaxID=115336 RepID=A0ABN3KA62_9ACTN
MTEQTSGIKDRLRHHREVLAAAKDATPEERRAILDALRDDQEAWRNHRRARPLPPWLARRGTRRALAAVAVVPFGCGTAAAFLAPASLPSIALQAGAVAGVGAGLILLRRATRLLTEVPDAELDERELAERDRARGLAYLALACCVGLVALVAIADGPLLDTRAWEPLILGTLFTALLLPSAAAAWEWNELDDADQ